MTWRAEASAFESRGMDVWEKEREAATLISELSGAIAIMHAQGMCHADIKPENLLLTSKDADAHVKLVDFGNPPAYAPHPPPTASFEAAGARGATARTR